MGKSRSRVADLKSDLPALAVLRLIAKGRTIDQIALQMGLTRYRVRAHVGLILAKLGARDHAHAVAIAMREGLFR